MRDSWDLIVIGAGPAGQAAAEFAAWYGHSAVIVERARPGGVVTTTGGAPTKTLRELAVDLARLRWQGDAQPSVPQSLEAARPMLRTRTLAVCETLQNVVANQIASRGVEYLQGTASLGRDRSVAVAMADGTHRQLNSRAILIATGSRPAHPSGVPFDDPDVYDSDGIYALRRVPSDVAIVGGGPVGVEFATVFNALGIPTTLVSHDPHLLPTMDRELVDLLSSEFVDRGVRLVLGHGVERVTRRNARLELQLNTGATLDCGAVLFAAGRSANTTELGLDDAGVALDARGRIVVDEWFQTSVDGIYAAGDVVGPTLASIAMQQGRAAACHAFGLVFGVAVDRSSSAAVYGVPEIAGVGLTEEQARAQRVPYVVGRCDLGTTARGAIAGRGGRLKLIIRADDRRLLGVHCLGDTASELVTPGQVALHVGAAADLFLTLALDTPTYSQAYRQAAIDALTALTARLRTRGGAPTTVPTTGAAA